MLKCLADPLFIVIQTLFYGKKYSCAIQLTMIPMILGIMINSMYDLKFSPIGTFYALSAVLVTSVYTVVSILTSKVPKISVLPKSYA